MKLLTSRSRRAALACTVLALSSGSLLADGPQRKIASSSRAAVQASKTGTIQRQLVVDVALQQGGVLTGHLVDEQGRAIARSEVIIRQGRRVLQRGVTGAKGEFQFKGLRGGIYEVASDRGQQVFRIWSKGTAPRSARRTALIVSRQRQVVRGQFGDLGLSTLSGLGDVGVLGGMGTAGTVATVGVVAGITVGTVVAVNEADDDDDPAPAAMGGPVASP